MLRKISRQYVLTEQDAQGFGKLKVNGMQFRICASHAEGLGHVSVMTASGFFGLLKHGGPSTDVFKKGIGAEITTDLFRKVLFGTHN